MPAKYQVRGVEKQQERQGREIYRDSRRLGEKIYDKLSEPKVLAVWMIMCAVLAVLYPLMAEVSLITALILWFGFSGKSKSSHLPMRLPFEHNGKDYNDPFPGRSFFMTKYRQARGIFFLGNEMSTNEELHLSADDMLTHMLLFGTTGAGKTEALLSLSWNSISMGSGLIFIDPKGTNKLGLQIYTLARIVGRDDDYLQINFSTGNRDVNAHSPKRMSNTANPFAYGTADSLAEILVSLIPTSEGENAVFSERAVSLIYTIMRPLVDLRNLKVIQLSISTIRDHLTLEKCMELASDPRISDTSRKSMEAYLNSVAGFKQGQPYEKQGEDALKQFGFAQAYFTRALSSLVDTYGHVYGAMMGEVDYPDVVFNRRILCILLPAMEKPPSEIKTLGKIILSAIRGAMSLGLGAEFEGTKEEMLDSLPTASNVPNLVIADEYGYVATDGFAVTAAQARGLGFSCVFAGQDYAGFKRGSETEAEQILANTKVKIIMALEDAQATLEVVKAIGGEAFVTNTSGFTMDANAVTSAYRDTMNVSVEKRGRVDILDLRDQIEGEFHVFHKANMIRGRMFHADPPIGKSALRINRFLEILRPDPKVLSSKYGPVKYLTADLKKLVRGGPVTGEGKARRMDDDVIKAMDIFKSGVGRAKMSANETMLASLLLSFRPDEVTSHSSDASPAAEQPATMSPSALWGAVQSESPVPSTSPEQSATSTEASSESATSMPNTNVSGNTEVTTSQTDTKQTASVGDFGAMLGMPSFASAVLEQKTSVESSEDDEDEDEEARNAREMKDLLEQPLASEIIDSSKASAINNLSRKMSGTGAVSNPANVVKQRIGESVSEYPTSPTPKANDPARKSRVQQKIQKLRETTRSRQAVDGDSNA